LKNELKVSTGTIYHHLDTLSELIEQRNDKKYYLKDLGIYAYNSLKSNIDTIITPDFAHRELRSPLLRKLMGITSKRFNQFDKKDQNLTILISFTILLSGVIFCGLNSFFSFLLYFIELSNYQIYVSLSFIINFLVFFMIIEGFSRLFNNNKKNTIQFFISFGIIQFPMIFYLILHYTFMITDLLGNNVANFFDKIFLIIFQVWSLWLLSYSLCINKGLKIENSLIIALLLHYGGFTLILFTSF